MWSFEERVQCSFESSTPGCQKGMDMEASIGLRLQSGGMDP